MLKQRRCARVANSLIDVDSSGRSAPGKRSRTTGMFRCQIAAAALIAMTIAGCDKELDAACRGGLSASVWSYCLSRAWKVILAPLTGEVARQGRRSVLALRVDSAGRLEVPVERLGHALPRGRAARLARPRRSRTRRCARLRRTLRRSRRCRPRRVSPSRRQQAIPQGHGWATRAIFDDAQQKLLTVEAQVDSAQAQVRIAREHRATPCRSPTCPARHAVGAEPGEVVHAGQTVAQLAREGGRDAVFHVPEQIIRDGRKDPMARESPSATTRRSRRPAGCGSRAAGGSATRTFQVKVGIIDPPAAMRLGATVVGRFRLSAPPGVEVPASALTETDGRPACGWSIRRARPCPCATSRSCATTRPPS